MHLLDLMIPWIFSKKFVYFLCGMFIYFFGVLFFFQNMYLFDFNRNKHNEDKFLTIFSIFLSICLIILAFYFIIISFL